MLIVTALDAFGKEIDLDAEHDDENNAITKRGKWQVILKLGKILKRWGGRAWTFFKCIGYGAALKCGDEVSMLHFGVNRNIANAGCTVPLLRRGRSGSLAVHRRHDLRRQPGQEVRLS